MLSRSQGVGCSACICRMMASVESGRSVIDCFRPGADLAAISRPHARLLYLLSQPDGMSGQHFLNDSIIHAGEVSQRDERQKNEAADMPNDILSNYQ